MEKHHLVWLLIAMMLSLLVAGCRATPSLAPATQPVATAAIPETLPAAEASVLMVPEEGGTVRLRDGAEISLPPQALSAQAAVTLRVRDAVPVVPLPRSLLGRGYEFSLEGGQLTGVALVRLPLPVEATADEYDLAPYRWTGTAWERINGRVIGTVVRFGVGAPGLFALQGTWRLADATLALIKPDVPADQLKTPLAVAGQYRFSALPRLSGVYVPAQLTLKQDISGGAGRVTGNPDLDATIGEATLWFQPDPARSQGVIEFSHVFEVAAGDLDLAPGATTQLYAVLTVEDALAPTRRLSTGIEYTQLLPIRAVGATVVRPRLRDEGRYPLRWHVQLNGQTFLLQDATDLKLPLEDILARGGLGEYRVSLEAETAGTWAIVSNEVTVLLTLRPTETPAAIVQPPAGTSVAVVSPTSSAPGADQGRPATPTRRPTPATGDVFPTVTPGIPPESTTPTATVPVATATPPWNRMFWADRYVLTPGECTTLHWQVENVLAVFLDGQGVAGRDTREVCPTQTTNYTLGIKSVAGTQEVNVLITVTAAGQAAFEFTADSYRVALGQCTVLRWRATGVRAVYLNNQGVAGEDSRQVCPSTTTDYTLRVESTNGTVVNRTLTIVVTAGPLVDMRFWAEQYTLPANGCTVLHWDVRNVREVYLDDEGVAGTGDRQVCPTGSQFYALRVVTTDGLEAYQYVSLLAGDPGLAAGEIIAQGIVNEVTRQADLDPVTPGDQPGYRLIVDGVRVLFSAMAGWTQAVVTLRLPQQFLDIGGDDLVHWPINPGQLVEFRAACEGATCTPQLAQNSYLYLRSP
ncbi:MAG: hypothetical protein ACUVR4_11275 [Anaerolineae bacterium]